MGALQLAVGETHGKRKTSSFYHGRDREVRAGHNTPGAHKRVLNVDFWFISLINRYWLKKVRLISNHISRKT